ncbi:hypothetical protein L1049_020767 [Liquidambar formosana]|uniref:Uncharacterized protein n=1 Tax=Liquidambar formosana TaxID=63359 RepID=A0AAP0SD74_LIQFO
MFWDFSPNGALTSKSAYASPESAQLHEGSIILTFSIWVFKNALRITCSSSNGESNNWGLTFAATCSLLWNGRIKKFSATIPGILVLYGVNSGRARKRLGLVLKGLLLAWEKGYWKVIIELDAVSFLKLIVHGTKELNAGFPSSTTLFPYLFTLTERIVQFHGRYSSIL